MEELSKLKGVVESRMPVSWLDSVFQVDEDLYLHPTILLGTVDKMVRTCTQQVLRSLWNMERWVMVILSQFILKTMRKDAWVWPFRTSATWFDYPRWTSPSIWPIGFVSRDDRNLLSAALRTHLGIHQNMLLRLLRSEVQTGILGSLMVELNVFPHHCGLQRQFLCQRTIDTEQSTNYGEF